MTNENWRDKGDWLKIERMRKLRDWGKKKYIQELENKVNNMTDEISNLKNENLKLKSINKQLNEQVTESHTFLSSMGVQFGNINFGNVNFPKVDYNNSVRTGVTLFVLLFSFSVFFNMNWNNKGSFEKMADVFSEENEKFKFYSNSYNSDNIGEIIPESLKVKNKNNEKIKTRLPQLPRLPHLLKEGIDKLEKEKGIQIGNKSIIALKNCGVILLDYNPNSTQNI